MADLSRKLPPKCLVVCILERGKDENDWKYIIFTNKVNPQPIEKDDYFFLLNKCWIIKKNWDEIVDQYSIQKRELGGFFQDFINYNYKLVANVRAMRFLKEKGYKILIVKKKGKGDIDIKSDYKVNFTKKKRWEDREDWEKGDV